MELLTSCWEKMDLSDGDSLDLSNIINIVRENTCLKKECINSMDNLKKEKIRIVPLHYISFITLKSLTEYFSEFIKNKTDKSYHFPCVIEMLHLLYKDIVKKTNADTSKTEGTDATLLDLVTLSKKCLEQPSLISPVPIDTECESTKTYNDTIKANITVTSHCFQFYLDILFTHIRINGQMQINKDESRISSLEEPSSNQKYILKKTASKALILACSRLGEQPWTNTDVKKICYDVIRCIKLCSKYDSYSNLLSGMNNKDSVMLFQNGLFGHILNDLMPSCHKDTWKKNIPSIHALLWCLKKVNYPYLSQHVQKIVPPLLLLTDDYITDHKLLGILSLTHLIENVNPSDLKLYNHAAVIYDVLILQLYSNQPDIYEVTLTCLLKLLPVLHSKPDVINGITYTPWDASFVKVMENVNMTSKIDTELVLLKFIPEFIDKMGGNTIKHIDKIINLISLPIQGDGEDVTKKRLYTLKILSVSIQVCWPVIHTYQTNIFKIVIKMLIDLCMASCVGRNSRKEEVEDEICNVLVLMKLCCGTDAEDVLSSILKITFDTQLDAVRHVVKRVIDTKEFVK